MRFSCALFVASALAWAAPACAQESILHGFAAAGDGNDPDSTLIVDAGGTLYGTTQTGGVFNDGTVFRLTPPAVAGGAWTNTVLYSFQGAADGYFPQSPLVEGAGGVLYGTTDMGGAGGYGVVFALSPPSGDGGSWTETTLFAFTGGADGGYPYHGAGLIIDASGTLYGTTLRGGTNADGVAFSLKPPNVTGNPWKEKVLHSFAGGSDGYFPKGGLVADGSGALYGTTAGGGTSFSCSGGCGTVFRLTPPAAGGTHWTKATLRSFMAGVHGSQPEATLIIDANGALYGTTYFGGGSSACGSYGCGTVFRLSAPASGGAHWVETTLHAFQSGTDSEYPVAGVVSDAAGDLFGTAYGAYPNRLGAVFKLTPPAAGGVHWKETILHSFAPDPDGNSPAGALVAGAGVFYGTTNYGGGAGAGICGNGCGTVYQITP